MQYIADDIKKLLKNVDQKIREVITQEFDSTDVTFLKGFYFIITSENPDKNSKDNDTIVTINSWAKDKKELIVLLNETINSFSEDIENKNENDN